MHTTPKTFEVDTEVATLMLFHPDDLAAHADWSTGWYAAAFAYAPLAKAGTLLAFGMGNDGIYWSAP